MPSLGTFARYLPGYLSLSLCPFPTPHRSSLLLPAHATNCPALSGLAVHHCQCLEVHAPFFHHPRRPHPNPFSILFSSLSLQFPGFFSRRTLLSSPTTITPRPCWFRRLTATRSECASRQRQPLRPCQLRGHPVQSPDHIAPLIENTSLEFSPGPVLSSIPTSFTDLPSQRTRPTDIPPLYPPPPLALRLCGKLFAHLQLRPLPLRAPPDSPRSRTSLRRRSDRLV